MWITRRTLGTMVAAVSGALAMTLVVGAFGALGKPHAPKSHPNHPNHQGKHIGAPLIDESLAPSEPTDPMFHGVRPGNAPWVLKLGNVRLKQDGKFDLRVKGLVIPPPQGMSTPGPVTTISASLYCGADLNMVPAGTTQQVPISPDGDARIHDTSFTVPAVCLAPVILVHPNGLPNLYIALDGWRFS
jgi:hypothetical protein